MNSDERKAVLDELIEQKHAELMQLERDEEAKARSMGYHVCPACRDWLPLDLVQFRCLGRGNHVNTAPPIDMPEPEPVEIGERGAMWFIGVAIVLLVLAMLSAFVQGHR